MILCGRTTARTGDRYGAGVRHPPPPRGGKQAEGGEGGSGLRRLIAYVKINDGAYVFRDHCTSLEHHHLMIQIHSTYRWTGKQQQYPNKPQFLPYEVKVALKNMAM